MKITKLRISDDRDRGVTVEGDGTLRMMVAVFVNVSAEVGDQEPLDCAIAQLRKEVKLTVVKLRAALKDAAPAGESGDYDPAA